MKKTILVIGATGKQGGSVMRYLINDGTFNVRAFVRSKKSDIKCESVVGNLNDVVSLCNAMEDCYGVFAVTNFWDPSVGYEGEIEHAKNIGDACKMMNIKHLVFSTLDRDSNVPHFESKVIGEDYIKSLKIPTTCLVTSFYYENFLTFFSPKETESGDLLLNVAQKSSTKVPMFSVDDTGLWALEAFKHPETYINKDISAVTEYLCYPEVANIFTCATGKKCNFVEIPLDVYKGFGFPGVDELAANLSFFNEIHEGSKVDRRKNGMTSIVGKNLQSFLSK